MNDVDIPELELPPVGPPPTGAAPPLPHGTLRAGCVLSVVCREDRDNLGAPLTKERSGDGAAGGGANSLPWFSENRHPTVLAARSSRVNLLPRAHKYTLG